MTQPTDHQLKALWNHCAAFITAERIACAETVYQTDLVEENTCDFIVGVADIVGYAGEVSFETPDQADARIAAEYGNIL